MLGIDRDQHRHLLRDSSRRGVRRSASDRPPVASTTKRASSASRARSFRAGTIGELQLRGEGLTTGYLNQPELNAERLLAAADGGLPWYRTGDLVVELPTGDLRYAGRIGRMVKLRGYRVEPGEIETRLYEHPAIKEAGVVAVEGPRGLELVAHVSGTRVCRWSS